MYHIFCIHSSVDGHLGYFNVLLIVKHAAVNMGFIEHHLIITISERPQGLWDTSLNTHFKWMTSCLLFYPLLPEGWTHSTKGWPQKAWISPSFWLTDALSR